MTKLKNILMAALLTMSTAAMADNYAYLTVDDTNGENSFSLNEIKKITFDTANMIITMTNGSTTQLPLASLNKMFFSETGITGIAAQKQGSSQVKLIDGVIHVNAPAGSVITLFNMGGQAVRTMTSATDDTQINVSSLTKGVYIVKVGNLTKKVMNK